MMDSSAKKLFSAQSHPRIHAFTNVSGQITYGQFLRNCSQDPTFFVDFLHETTLNYDSYFFETCPVSRQNVNQINFEFVVIESEFLHARRADPSAFQERFKHCKNQEILTFQVSHGNTLMVVPSPPETNYYKGGVLAREFGKYSHIASFMEVTDRSKVRKFWQRMAQEMLKTLETCANQRLWMSTAGEGIPWVHGRIDKSPEHYKYLPFSKPLFCSETTFEKEILNEHQMKFKAVKGNKSMSYGDVLKLFMSKEDRILDQFVETLGKKCPFEAYHMMCPRVDKTCMNSQPFEFVLTQESLKNFEPINTHSYQDNFVEESKFVNFANVYSDAMLVCPCPPPNACSGQLKAYTNMASYMKSAPTEDSKEFWQFVAKVLMSMLEDNLAIWMLTYGLKVHWVTVRLDSNSQFSTYQPYA